MVELVATGCYLGRIGGAPGTFGTIGAIIVWYLSLSLVHHEVVRWGLPVLFTLLGLLASHAYLAMNSLGPKTDPSEIVIDEWAGMAVALTVVPLESISQILGAFFLFRFYDILKPWPVNRLERLPGALGIMCDDVAAGFLALVSLLLLRFAVMSVAEGYFL